MGKGLRHAVELRRQRIDDVVADLQVDTEAGNAHREPLDLVVGPPQPEVAAQCPHDRLMQGCDPMLDLLHPQAGGLEHLAAAQLDRLMREIPVAQRFEKAQVKRTQGFVERL